MNCLAILLLFSTIFLNGCTNELPQPTDLGFCDSDQDCIIVNGRGCCGCYDVINKQHEKWWNERKVEECPGRTCEVCPDKPVSVRCVNNVCYPDMK